MRDISDSEVTTILSKDFTGEDTPSLMVLVKGYLLPNILSMSITREESSITQQIDLQLDNVNPTNYKDTGYYTQTRNDTANGKPQNQWYHVLQPGQEISVYAGYGVYLNRIFTGKILTAKNKLSGNNATIEIIGINNGRLLKDGKIVYYDTIAKKRIWNITYPIGSDIFEFFLTSADTNPYLHEIFKDVCMRAGISASNILYDSFSLQLNDVDEDYFTEMSGSWESIVYKISKLLNAAVFINEENQIEMREKKDLSYSFDGQITLSGTTWLELDINATNKDRVIEDSIVFDASYEKDVDWEYDLELNSIRRTVGSTIPDGTPVDVIYNYVNWIFRHGEGIHDFESVNSHEGLYSRILARNEDLDLESLVELGILGDGSTLDYALIHKEDLPEFTTQGQLDDWATDKKNEIKRQYWAVKASVVAVPHLQINDLIQFYIVGIVTGIYKITGFSLIYTPDNGFDMYIESTFYSNYNEYE